MVGTQRGTPREVLEQRQAVPTPFDPQDARIFSSGIGQQQEPSFRLSETVLRGNGCEVYVFSNNVYLLFRNENGIFIFTSRLRVATLSGVLRKRKDITTKEVKWLCEILAVTY